MYEVYEMKKFNKIFLSGLFTILPLSITVFVISIVFNFLDSFGTSAIEYMTGYKIPGLGLLLTVLLIFLIGLFMQIVVGKRIFKAFENLIGKIPFIKSVYNGTKGIAESFSKMPDKNFSSVVMLNFPNEYTKSIGFVTNQSVYMDETERISVFIPTTPNPTNGFLIFTEKENVTPLDISIDDAVKAIISMGSAFNNKKSG